MRNADVPPLRSSGDRAALTAMELAAQVGLEVYRWRREGW